MKKIQKCSICNRKLDDLGTLDVPYPGYYKTSRLVMCHYCSVAWVTPSPNEATISRCYADTYHFHPNKLFDLVLFQFFNRVYMFDSTFIEQHICKGRVLDIGAGRGDMLRTLDRSRWEKWAFDPYISQNEMQYIRMQIGERVNSFRNLNEYNKNNFDLVILRNIIEHTQQFNTLLSDVHKIVKKGGYIYIRTPNINSLDFTVFGKQWYVITMIGHVVFFGRNSIEKILNSHGFLCKKIIYPNRSPILSFYRSTPDTYGKIQKIVLSVLYYLMSPFLGTGYDLCVLAQKK